MRFLAMLKEDGDVTLMKLAKISGVLILNKKDKYRCKMIFSLMSVFVCLWVCGGGMSMHFLALVFETTEKQ